MTALVWTPELTTGVAGIDKEHLEILRLARRLGDNPHAFNSATDGRALLKHMEVHVTKHFFAEEEVMARHSYPKLLEHMAEHGRLIEYVLSLCRDVRDEEADQDLLSVSNRLLCNWLVTHINTHDRDLAGFLQSLGTDAKPPPTGPSRLKTFR